MKGFIGFRNILVNISNEIIQYKSFWTLKWALMELHKIDFKIDCLLL